MYWRKKISLKIELYLLNLDESLEFTHPSQTLMHLQHESSEFLTLVIDFLSTANNLAIEYLIAIDVVNHLVAEFFPSIALQLDIRIS